LLERAAQLADHLVHPSLELAHDLREALVRIGRAPDDPLEDQGDDQGGQSRGNGR
jgi:hypothetical protein